MDTMGCQQHLHSENVSVEGFGPEGCAVLSVPIPGVLQKGKITVVSGSFQLTRVQMYLMCFSHGQRLEKFNALTKRIRGVGRES